MTSTSSVDFVKLFDKYMEFLRHENGKLSKFWYDSDSPEAFESIEGRQMGTTCFSTVIRSMIPWCFEYDNMNYICKIFLSEMSHLGKEHPDVLAYLRSAGFSAQIEAINTFSRIPVDQTCEETVNRDLQTPGGTKGFSLKPGAVSKYYLMAEY